MTLATRRVNTLLKSQELGLPSGGWMPFRCGPGEPQRWLSSGLSLGITRDSNTPSTAILSKTVSPGW